MNSKSFSPQSLVRALFTIDASRVHDMFLMHGLRRLQWFRTGECRESVYSDAHIESKFDDVGLAESTNSPRSIL